MIFYMSNNFIRYIEVLLQKNARKPHPLRVEMNGGGY